MPSGERKLLAARGLLGSCRTEPPMDERSERIAKRFEVPMLIAATLVIPTIIIEEAGPGEPLATLGVVLNYLTERTQGLLGDAEPEDGDGARPRAADRFQVDPGEARG